MENNLIRVVVKKPLELAEIVMVENSLASFQKIVGGYIESVGSIFPYPFCMYINEEGKLIELTPNIVLPHGDYVAGTLVVLSTDGEGNNIGLTEAEAERITNILNPLGNYFKEVAEAEKKEVKLDFSDSAAVRKFIEETESGMYSGKNVDGEKVALMHDKGIGFDLHTYQNNGWVRVNDYGKNGYCEGETFNGRWK